MKKLSAKEQMDIYELKCNALGLEDFEFDYNEHLDIVIVTSMRPDTSNEIRIPEFVSKVSCFAWHENNSMKDCKLVIPKGCLLDLGSRMIEGLALHTGYIEVEAGHKYYSSKDGVLFNKDKTVLLVYPSYKEDESYSIPSSVLKIEYDAFFYSTCLKKLNISKNVIQMGICYFYEETKITVNKENTAYKSIRGSLYSKDGKILYSLYAPQGSKIKIEDGTVLMEDIIIEGNYKELYLPDSIKFSEMRPGFLDMFMVDFYVIKAPKRLRKYIKDWEDYSKVIYY